MIEQSFKSYFSRYHHIDFVYVFAWIHQVDISAIIIPLLVLFCETKYLFRNCTNLEVNYTRQSTEWSKVYSKSFFLSLKYQTMESLTIQHPILLNDDDNISCGQKVTKSRTAEQSKVLLQKQFTLEPSQVWIPVIE